MKANYHTHTVRCGHAVGTDEEYIKAAIAKGLTTLGFSDHTPYYFPDRVSYLDDRMHPHELEDYFSSLLSLREKYKDYIDIRIGLETEYYPLLWDMLLEDYGKYPLEYLILGQHRIGNVHLPPSHSAFARSEDTEELKQYADQTIDAMNTGRFTYVAHPDVFYFKGDMDAYEEQMSRIILRANELKLPLEFNLNGIRGRKWYPKDELWRIAARLGAKAVIGCDAHAPEEIAIESELTKAHRILDKLGIELLDEIELINPLS